MLAFQIAKAIFPEIACHVRIVFNFLKFYSLFIQRQLFYYFVHSRDALNTSARRVLLLYNIIPRSKFSSLNKQQFYEALVISLRCHYL